MIAAPTSKEPRQTERIRLKCTTRTLIALGVRWKILRDTRTWGDVPAAQKPCPPTPVHCYQAQVSYNWDGPTWHLPNMPCSEKVPGKYTAGCAKTPPTPEPTTIPSDEETSNGQVLIKFKQQEKR